MEKELVNKIEIKVRFNEVDSMKVVWHGHYLKYFEDGREAFGEQYKISYMDFYENDILVPLVNIEVDYKKSLKCGEHAIVETKFVHSKSAKLLFNYTIYNSKTNEIVATGKSTQVFLDKKGDLMLCIPKFYHDWKKKWDLL